MAKTRRPSASLIERIEREAACNAAAQVRYAERAKREARQFSTQKELTTAWVRFGERKVLSAPADELPTVRTAAIDDLMEIGRLLTELDVVARVLRWGRSRGVSGETAAEVLRAAAEGRRDAVDDLLNRTIFRPSAHSPDLRPFRPDDITAIYSHLVSFIPAALRLPHFQQPALPKRVKREEHESAQPRARARNAKPARKGKGGRKRPAIPTERTALTLTLSPMRRTDHGQHING